MGESRWIDIYVRKVFVCIRGIEGVNERGSSR